MKKQIIILGMAAFFAAAGMAGAQNAPEQSRNMNMKHMNKTIVKQQQNTSGTHNSHMMMRDSSDKQKMNMMNQQGNMMNNKEEMMQNHMAMMQKHMAMMQQMMAMHQTMMQDSVMKKNMMAMMQKNGMNKEMMQGHMQMMQKCMTMHKQMMQDSDNAEGKMNPMNTDHHKIKQTGSRPEMKKMDRKTGMNSSSGLEPLVFTVSDPVNYKSLK